MNKSGHTRRILFIIPSLEGGGAERVLINLLNQLKELTQFQITVCCVLKKGVYVNAIPDGIEVKFLFRSKIICKIVEKITRDLYLDYLLKARVKHFIKGRFDVGVSFLDSIYSDILFYLDSRLDKKVVVLHSSYLTYSNRSRFIQGKYKLKLQRRYERVDTIVSVSNDAQQEFIEAFGRFRDMRVIYNFMNMDQVRQRAKEDFDHSPDAGLQLLSIGSLIPVKNHMRLLRAAELLVKDNIDFHLRILGKGILQQKLQAFIEEKELHEYVELKGFVENPYPILRSSDVFVLSSIAEGLPTVLAEAMALGIPVVATNCPGSREILDQGRFGILTEQDDHALYEGLKRMNNEEERVFFKSKSLERAKIFDDQLALREYVSLLE
jgi:glycosyltransferase involved in cell wall biosynthesis